MQISCFKNQVCEIKTKAAKIIFDDHIKINDLTLPGPGEYEVGGVFFEINDHVVHFHVEDIALIYLKNLKTKLSEEDLEQLESVDVVILEPKSKEELETAAHFINQIDPQIVVIRGNIKPQAVGAIEGQKPQVVNTLKITKADLPSESRLLYLLTA